MKSLWNFASCFTGPAGYPCKVSVVANLIAKCRKILLWLPSLLAIAQRMEHNEAKTKQSEGDNMLKQYHDIIIDYVVFQCISDISSRRFRFFMFSARNLECSDVLSLGARLATCLDSVLHLLGVRTWKTLWRFDSGSVPNNWISKHFNDISVISLHYFRELSKTCTSNLDFANVLRFARIPSFGCHLLRNSITSPSLKVLPRSSLGPLFLWTVHVLSAISFGVTSEY